jgi:hypothetical protein
MSGQSAALSLKEAKAMQERIHCGKDSHGDTHPKSNAGHEIMKKEASKKKNG